MLRMKCSAYWVYYDIPLLFIFRITYYFLLSSRMLKKSNKSIKSDLIKKIRFIRKNLDFFQPCPQHRKITSTPLRWHQTPDHQCEWILTFRAAWPPRAGHGTGRVARVDDSVSRASPHPPAPSRTAQTPASSRETSAAGSASQRRSCAAPSPRSRTLTPTDREIHTYRQGDKHLLTISGVELRTLDYENPGSNPVLRC